MVDSDRRPSEIYRPILTQTKWTDTDGNERIKYKATYDCVSGTGNSPELAMKVFDHVWTREC